MPLTRSEFCSRTLAGALLAALTLAITACAGVPAPDKPLPIHPKPTHVEYRHGYFKLRPGAPLLVGSINARAAGIAHEFAIKLAKRRDIQLDVHPFDHGAVRVFDKPPIRRDAVTFYLNPNNLLSPTGNGYRLLVSKHHILLASRTPAGLERGSEALLQLLIAGKPRGHRVHVRTMLILDKPTEEHAHE
jgi:hypothetical protein